jgi:hypothetical protein
MWLKHVGGIDAAKPKKRTYTYRCAVCGQEAEGDL